MTKLTKTALVAAMLFTSVASASDIRLDLTNFGGNLHDSTPVDANNVTATFEEFGFTGLWATSVYDYTDGAIAGSFYDTNIESELLSLGITPTGVSGIALDGVTTVDLRHGICNQSVAGVDVPAGGECDIDALNPIAPPIKSDSEGFLMNWDFKVEYHFDGTLSSTGPKYTGGYMKVYFNSFIDSAYDKLAFSANLVSSKLEIANLGLFFDVTYAEAGFLNIWNGSSFVDAATALSAGYVPTISLDTNVHPPVPTDDILLLVNNGKSAVRQSKLDGTFTADIPEPGSIALIGLGLFGLGFSARRNKKS